MVSFRMLLLLLLLRTSLESDDSLERLMCTLSGGEDQTLVQCRDQTVLRGDYLPAE